MDYTYEEIIKGINEGTLDEVRFAIPSYPHYRDCVLRKAFTTVYSRTKRNYSTSRGREDSPSRKSSIELRLRKS